MADPLAEEIRFKIVRDKRMVDIPTSWLVAPSEFERVMNKSIRKGVHLFTTQGRGLTAKSCFDAVVNDGTRTVLLIPKGEEIEIDGQLIASGAESMVEGPRKKRMVTPGSSTVVSQWRSRRAKTTRRGNIRQ